MTNIVEPFTDYEIVSAPCVSDIPLLETPEPYIRTLPSNDGFHHIELPSGHDAICLTSYRDVKTIMLDRTASRALCNVDGGPSFMPTNWAPEVLINLDAPLHGIVREFVAHEFSSFSLAKLKPMVKSLTQRTLETLKNSHEPDMMNQVFRLIPAQIVCAILGVSSDYASWVNEMGRRIQLARPDQVPIIVESWNALYGWVQNLVSDNAKHDKNGLLAIYKERALEPEFRLLDDELLSGTIMGIVLGGDNNIVTMLSKILYTALSFPKIYNDIVAEPFKIPDLVEEILRLMPLGTPGSFPRKLTRPLLTSNGLIPTEMIVYPHINAANRDSEFFPNPLEIRLDRPRGRHLQYGYGMHRCMGSALAQIELITILECVVEYFPNLKLRVTPEEIPWDLGIGLRRPSELPVTLGF